MFSPLRSLLAPRRWRHSPGQEQIAYYRRTASSYEDSHVHEADEHFQSLGHISRFISQLGVRSVLDSGCGTGRGIKFLRDRHPEVEVHGNDPSAELLEVAHARNGIPSKFLHHGDTVSLAFEPARFDAVISLGVLHHVPNPDELIRKMVSLARKAVFISDCNYMGQGSLPSCVLKYAATQIGVWPLLKYVQQGFKGWGYSEGDGVYYSYSIFNDLRLITDAFPNTLVIPVGQRADHAAEFPVLRAGSVLVAAMR